jgi:hypothetical protein
MELVSSLYVIMCFISSFPDTEYSDWDIFFLFHGFSIKLYYNNTSKTMYVLFLSDISQFVTYNLPHLKKIALNQVRRKKKI